MSTFELNGDDVVLMEPNKNLTGAKLSRVKDIHRGFKDKLSSFVPPAWFKEGVECEFLKASTGGGWQKGKVRIREIRIHFEFVPDEPEPSPDSSALAPLPELPNPEQQ